MSDETDIRDAAEAEQLLNHPAFKKVFDGMRTATIEKWRQCDKGPERDDLWRLYNVLHLFPQTVRVFIERGTVAVKTGEQKENWLNRFKKQA